jgi:hypothetical protein
VHDRVSSKARAANGARAPVRRAKAWAAPERSQTEAPNASHGPSWMKASMPIADRKARSWLATTSPPGQACSALVTAR